VIHEDRFGRMFPGVEPFFRENSPRLQEALRDIGKREGMLDALDELADGGKQAAIDLIVNPDLSRNNPNNPAHTAGTTFMGQFLDHDMTFDLSSRLAVVTDPLASPNERTPAFDLERRSAAVSALQGCDLVLLQHGFHHAPRLGGIRIAQHLAEDRGVDLPREPVAVLEPPARPLLAAGAERAPVGPPPPATCSQPRTRWPR